MQWWLHIVFWITFDNLDIKLIENIFKVSKNFQIFEVLFGSQVAKNLHSFDVSEVDVEKYDLNLDKKPLNSSCNHG